MVKLKTSLVKCDFPLKQKQMALSLQEHICEELKGIDLDKLDPELVHFICNKIENEFDKLEEKDKIGKKEIFFQIYDKLFDGPKNKITDADKEILSKMIDKLLKHGLVKKVKMTKVISFWMKKHFLNI